MTVMVPTFIEVMDMSIVNVSLPHVQGSLNAGLDEATWVLTSYLVSNAVIIPITGWMASVFGRKRYLLFSLTLFTVSSIVCGAAPSLETLVLFRILQGLGGGGLQPLSQAILLESFPPAEHGIAMAAFGMGVVLAPILGPVVGGWITDNWSWRWVFYINLPAGILAIILALFFIHDPAYVRKRNAGIDAWGLFLLTLGLGCLQVVLDKGEREDWLSSDFIIALSFLAFVALVLFVIVELKVKNPVVDLRAFKDRSFATGTVIMFAGFFCLFGSFILLPLYAQRLMNYTALWAGLILGPGGVASFLVMPVAGILMKKGVSPRSLLAIGLMASSYALWLMGGFTLDASFTDIALPRVVQAFGLGLFFVPLSAATYVNIPKEKIGNASGIFNLVRNLGGSFGVAFSTTLLAQRAQAHQSYLVEHVTPYNPNFRAYYNQLSEWIQSQHPQLAGPAFQLAVIYREVLKQANMLAFNDAFRALALGAAVLIPLTLLFKKASTRTKPMGGMH